VFQSLTPRTKNFSRRETAQNKTAGAWTEQKGGAGRKTGGIIQGAAGVKRTLRVNVNQASVNDWPSRIKPEDVVVDSHAA